MEDITVNLVIRVKVSEECKEIQQILESPRRADTHNTYHRFTFPAARCVSVGDYEFLRNFPNVD